MLNRLPQEEHHKETLYQARMLKQSQGEVIRTLAWPGTVDAQLTQMGK